MRQGQPGVGSETSQSTLVWPEARRGQSTEAYEAELRLDGGDLLADERIQDAIDHSLLDMLRSLQFPNEEEEFADRIAAFVEKTAMTLRAIRTCLYQRDCQKLEGYAQELSHNALMVGAARILRLSYELQGFARCDDCSGAEAIADQCELEFIRVQQGLKQAI